MGIGAGGGRSSGPTAFAIAFGGAEGFLGQILEEANDVRKEHPEWPDQEVVRVTLWGLERKLGLRCCQEVAFLEVLFPDALDKKAFVIDSTPLRERIRRVLAREVAKKMPPRE